MCCTKNDMGSIQAYIYTSWPITVGSKYDFCISLFQKVNKIIGP